MRVGLFLLLFAVFSQAFAHVTQSVDLTAKQGETFSATLEVPVSNDALTGRTLLSHWRRLKSDSETQLTLSTANSRLTISGAREITVSIGADDMALLDVRKDVEIWYYDVHSIGSTASDVRWEFTGRVTVSRAATRQAESTEATRLKSLVSYDPQTPTTTQAGQARSNIGFDEAARDVVGATLVAGSNVTLTVDDPGNTVTIAASGSGGGGSVAWGDVTGTLSNQTDLNSALSGKEASGTAASAVAAHALASDPHSDRSFATSAIATHAALTTTHGISAFGSTLVDDLSASAARSTLGLGTAALSSTTDFEAAGAITMHNGVTTAHGISSYGATLVNNVDAASARTTLGLGSSATESSASFAATSHNHAAADVSSGTLAHVRGGLAADVSAYSGVLKIASGVTSAVPITTAGEALLDDADASAQRTTLGLGTAATTASVDYATSAQGVDDRTASGLRTASGIVATSTATAPTTGQVLTATSGTAASWQTPSSGGGSGDVVGPASATDNALVRFDSTTGKLIQDSGVTIGDVSGSSVSIGTTSGNALTLSATAPAATTGATQVGKSITISASPAVASTNTAGAAVGGDVNFVAGAAARLTSGNSDGGGFTWTAGAGIGTGVKGSATFDVYQMRVPGGNSFAPGISFIGYPTYGISFNAFTMRFLYNTSAYITISAGNVDFNSLTVTGNSATTSLSGFKRKTNTIAGGTASVTGVNSMALHSNSSATSLAIQNLPAASAGLEFEYYVLDADGIKLVALAGDDIRVIDKVTATGGYIQSTTIGSSVRLVAVDNTTWFALPIQGVWTDGTFTYDDTSLTTP